MEVRIMAVENDRKVKKHVLFVVILTQDYRIMGEIHVLPGSRLTDYVNSQPDENFVAMTNAEIVSLVDNIPISKVDYLALNKSYINMIYPLES
jgi:hypothetical protein